MKVTDVMLPWGRRPLYVLPAGKVPPNPSELLGSSQMKALLDEFAKSFDVVVCDAPPLLPVTDAAVLSRLTAGAIVVTAAGRVERSMETPPAFSVTCEGSTVAIAVAPVES